MLGEELPQELEALERDYSSAKDSYASILKRYEEAQLADSLEQAKKPEAFRILDSPDVKAQFGAENAWDMIELVTWQYFHRSVAASAMNRMATAGRAMLQWLGEPFVLTTDELPKYFIRYLGREQVDEIGTFVFAVKPKKLESGKRYFEGQVWVDDRDLQIVKSYGRGVGLMKRGADNQYPKFETYRQQIDGKYWFPTYTIANDTLQFKEGPQRMRMTVKYEDYKQFKSDINIKFGNEVKDETAKPEPKKPETKKDDSKKPDEKKE